jgi:protein-L-isoaspartate(D-aspartate) O-methyltransferase
MEDSLAVALDNGEARSLRAALVQDLRDEVKDVRVLDAMMRVPRHLFAPSLSLGRAYRNDAQPIGFEQTISQPSVVAIMSEALALTGVERVLEIGTGSGYQAAVLSLLARAVWSIEIVKELAQESAARLAKLGYANVHVREGDGYLGWSEEAPFDRIIATAAPEHVPDSLFGQLVDGGILVAPIGEIDCVQSLLVGKKRGGAIAFESLGAVRFVPMVHSA